MSRKGYAFAGFSSPGKKTGELAYRASQVAREEGVAALSLASDAHLTASDLKALWNLSRKLYRDSPIYHAAVNRLVALLCGPHGPVLKSKYGTREQNQTVEALWKTHLETIEIRGLDRGADFARAVYKNYIVDGEIGGILLADAKIQIVEASRLDGGTSRDTPGVELDEYRRPVAYYVLDKDKKPQRQSAENFILCANRDMPDQTRGVPLLTAGLPNFLRIEDVLNAECQSWRLLARLAYTCEHDPESPMPAFGEERDATDKQVFVREEELTEGLIVHAKSGEKITPNTYSRPGPSFRDSIYLYINISGASVGLPVEYLLMDWSRWNYSSSRAQFEQVYAAVTDIASRVANGFWTPLFKRFVADAVAKGLLPKSKTADAHEWTPPPFPFLDPQKEFAAMQEQLEVCATTQARIGAILGQDPEDVRKERADELIAAAREARRVAEESAGVVSAREAFLQFSGQAASKTQAAFVAKNAGADPSGKPGQDANADSGTETPKTPDGAPDPAVPATTQEVRNAG